MHRVIHLHVDAPAKPPEGAACNGCGVCCASEPCPLGIAVGGRRVGACSALRWSAPDARYRCGLVDQPADQLPAALAWTAPLVSRLARRWIAAGAGCDCAHDVDPGPDTQLDGAATQRA